MVKYNYITKVFDLSISVVVYMNMSLEIKAANQIQFSQ